MDGGLEDQMKEGLWLLRLTEGQVIQGVEVGDEWLMEVGG